MSACICTGANVHGLRGNILLGACREGFAVCVCVGTREIAQEDVRRVGGNWHVHVLGAACTKQGAVPALLALHTETYEGSPPGHPAEGFGELRALHLQLLQELWGQADVHGQGEALADILQRGARE